MKTTWDWSLDSETDCLLESARGISNGFFALQYFTPLAWTPNLRNYLPSGVYLPILPYSSIPHFWSSVAKLDNRTYPLSCPNKLFTATKALLSNLHLSAPTDSSLTTTLTQVLPKMITSLAQIVPSITLPQEILIHPTYFGTSLSFNHMGLDRQIILYLRLDQGIRSIVEGILTSLLRQSAIDDLSATWSETEFLIDWLLSKSVLSTLLPPDSSWVGTLQSTRNCISQSILESSQKFLHSINAPSQDVQKFKLKNHQIYFDRCRLTSLTAREIAVMTRLIEVAPGPLSTDELADLIFSCEDKYSLAALAKFIERLRAKLEAAGIPPHYLATANSQGYYLKN